MNSPERSFEIAAFNMSNYPNEELVNKCRKWAEESGGSITLTEDTEAAVKGADVIYTDVWVSMGEPDEVWKERIADLTPYKVTMDKMNKANSNAVFMHCLFGKLYYSVIPDNRLSKYKLAALIHLRHSLSP